MACLKCVCRRHTTMSPPVLLKCKVPGESSERGVWPLSASSLSVHIPPHTTTLSNHSRSYSLISLRPAVPSLRCPANTEMRESTLAVRKLPKGLGLRASLPSKFDSPSLTISTRRGGSAQAPCESKTDEVIVDKNKKTCLCVAPRTRKSG